MLLMGKSTISMAIFNCFLYVHQRVSKWESSRVGLDLGFDHCLVPLLGANCAKFFHVGQWVIIDQ